MFAKSSRISVVVPVLDEEESLGHLLPALGRFPQLAEIVVVDGGSRDLSETVARGYGVRWIVAERGRGSQMDAGARACGGEVVWFLHADCVPPPGSCEAILDALEDPKCIGGAFRFSLSQNRWWGSLVSFWVNLRSQWLGLPYGDQGYFVRREVYEKVGGFAAIPILEDVDFVRRLRNAGRIQVMPVAMGISPRRWDADGFARRTLLNWMIVGGYLLGASPETLVRFYRRPSGQK